MGHYSQKKDKGNDGVPLVSIDKLLSVSNYRQALFDEEVFELLVLQRIIRHLGKRAILVDVGGTRPEANILVLSHTQPAPRIPYLVFPFPLTGFLPVISFDHASFVLFESVVVQPLSRC